MGRTVGENPLVGIFPGQGSEYLGMLRSLKGYTIVDKVFGEVKKLSGVDLYRFIMEGPLDTLKKPLNAQLSVFGVSVCYWELLKKRYKFKTLAGHSLGFYTALYASGAVGLKDSIKVIIEAQRAIEEISDNGRWAMTAIIGLRVDECEVLCANAGDVYVANVNSMTQVVISGKRDMVKYVTEKAIERGALSIREIDIPYPLHSPFMIGIGKRLMPFINGIRIEEPSIPVFDHTGRGFLKKQEIMSVLSEQLENKVLWRDVIMGLDSHVFLEVGPSDVLSKMVKWIKRDAEVITAEEIICRNS